jgi:tRNA 2-selenouridine synthase
MTARQASSTPATQIPAVSAADALRAATVIDLRSPSEFAQDHLPDAANVPLFDDTERALVGTLYRRRSPAAAFDEAREIARGRVRDLVAEIGRVAGFAPPAEDFEARLLAMTEDGIEGLEGSLEARPGELPEDAVVLHCWRGGLRSRSVVALLRALGLDCAVVLEGGYRAYRAEVVRAIAELELPPAFALRGLTGVGKTLVLRELERQRPGWTIDLEGLAGHRSSILGMVGLEPCTQKTFESRLLQRVRAGLGEAVVLEGESRKVGDVVLPERVWHALSEATNVELTAPPERRVRVLLDDYLATGGSRAELRERLPFIEQRLGPVKWDGALTGLLDEGRDEELVLVLLERYYDPLYRHSERGKRYAATIDSSDPERAAREIAALVEGRSA